MSAVQSALQIRAVAPLARIGASPSTARRVLSPGSRPVRVAILGCGTIGGPVARRLVEHRADLAARSGRDVEVVSILVRHTRPRDGIDDDLMTDDFEDILNTRPDVVIELLGGLDPASDLIARSLESGVHVVTANKAVIAKDGARLRAIADRTGARLRYEASVGAAIPILATLRQLAADRVESITAILNGSTNYILTRMHDEGLSQAQALAAAKNRGLVEPDPTADLSGSDAAQKLAILAQEAGLGAVEVDDIELEGISHITSEDVLFARRLGYTIKLVATCRRIASGDLELRVGPALVPRSHLLASVNLEQNGIVLNTELSGELFISGAGAGPKPTTAGVLGDLVRVIQDGEGSAASESVDAGDHASGRQERSGRAAIAPDLTPRTHLVRVAQQGGGAIAPRALFEALRQNGVATRRVDICADALRVLTHPATTAQLANVLGELGVTSPEAGLVVPLLDEDECANGGTGL